jgi:catechol 2,3-dioxygenase-like lactoylglutathione lyase family enzyme
VAGVIDHVDMVVADLTATRGFYEAALAPLGFHLLHEEGDAIGFGTEGNDDFWIRQGPQPEANNTTGAHLAFMAETNEAVDGFFAAATEGGGVDEPPGYQPEFSSWLLRRLRLGHGRKPCGSGESRPVLTLAASWRQESSRPDPGV